MCQSKKNVFSVSLVQKLLFPSRYEKYLCIQKPKQRGGGAIIRADWNEYGIMFSCTVVQGCTCYMVCMSTRIVILRYILLFKTDHPQGRIQDLPLGGGGTKMKEYGPVVVIALRHSFLPGSVSDPGPPSFLPGSVSDPGPPSFLPGSVRDPGPPSFLPGSVSDPGPPSFR